MKTKCIIVITLLIVMCSNAQQFVYKPINPAFGGDTFNYNWLLTSATSQNQFKSSGTDNLFDDLNSLDSFTQSLNRQLISQLSQKLFGDQLGHGELKPGTYVFGSMYLQVIQSDKGLIINILNTSTGEQSEITVPN